ncbi:succinate dehydrogenase [ubiquinone] cytochrome b small subunit, mitochondrial-like [Ornithodoros turicata]|uniref:Succinate dehydrogenase [ubiquinone] cytochrome b small subunit n=1 Tax=Ornithodoros turicata TaxID=34597 RepID=A0A2R5LHM8_9ACAR
MALNMLRLSTCGGSYLARLHSQRYMSTLVKKCAPFASTVNSTLVPASPRLTAIRSTSADASHVAVWKAERLLSAALLGIVPGAFLFPCPAMDYLLAASVTMHIHWGVETIVVDYVRPTVFGNVIPKVAVGAVYALSMLTLGGLFYFNYSDVGVAKAIKMFWAL